MCIHDAHTEKSVRAARVMEGIKVPLPKLVGTLLTKYVNHLYGDKMQVPFSFLSLSNEEGNMGWAYLQKDGVPLASPYEVARLGEHRALLAEITEHFGLNTNSMVTEIDKRNWSKVTKWAHGLLGMTTYHKEKHMARGKAQGHFASEEKEGRGPGGAWRG